MSCRIDKLVWYGHDNAIKLLLSNMETDGTKTPADLIAVQSMSLELEGQPVLTVNKNDVDAPIDWWDESLSQGEVILVLGSWAEENSVPLGRYSAALVSYDLAHPNGIVWTSHAKRELMIHIKD